MKANEEGGKPRRRWQDDIKEWMQMSVTQAGRLSQNRDAYIEHVRAATVLGTTFDTVTTDVSETTPHW